MELNEEERALLARLQQDTQEEASGLDEVEDVLRGMGLNHNERQALRRRHRANDTKKKHGRPRRRMDVDCVPFQDRIVKQFRWHIEQRVPDWSALDYTSSDAALTWAKLTNYKIELAQQWWDAGVKPSSLDQIVELLAHGFGPKDLGRRLQGRTIAEHLIGGSSVAWCVMAARWAKPQM